MDLDPNVVIPAVIVVAIMLLVGLPVHEFSHALAAYRLGDGTAKMFGRLTLNPIAHFDPVGGTLLAADVHRLGGVGRADRVRLGETDAGQPDEPRGRAPGRGARGGGRAALEPRAGRDRGAAAALHPRRPSTVDLDSMPVQVLVSFVQINLLLMIFNFIPIPPLDGSKVLFAFMDRRTEYQIRPFLEQYGFLILLAILFFPFGNSIGEPDHPADHSMRSSASWWASRTRQFRAHLRARVAPAERAALEAWTTPRTARAVRFDACRRPPARPRRRRVAARGRRDGSGRPDRRPAARRRQGRHRASGRGSPTRSASATASGSGTSARSCPGWRAALARLRTHAETSAVLAAAAGCSARTVALIRNQDAPIDPEFGELLRLADEAN